MSLLRDHNLAPWEDDPSDEAVMLEVSKRRTMIAQHEQDRRTMIWTGIGWGLLAIIVLTAAVVGLYLMLESAQQHGRDSVDLERARAEQVRACTELGEPLERQYCLLALDVDADGGGTSG